MRVERRNRAWGVGIGLVPIALIAGSTALGAPGPTATAANGTPTVTVPTGPGPGVTTGPVPTVPSTVTATQVIQLPSNASCVHQLRIGLSHPARVHPRTLGVKIGSRHIIRRPVPKSLTIHLLPPGFFTLRVSETTTTSGRFTRTRRYDRC